MTEPIVYRIPDDVPLEVIACAEMKRDAYGDYSCSLPLTSNAYAIAGFRYRDAASFREMSRGTMNYAISGSCKVILSGGMLSIDGDVALILDPVLRRKMAIPLFMIGMPNDSDGHFHLTLHCRSPVDDDEPNTVELLGVPTEKTTSTKPYLLPTHRIPSYPIAVMDGRVIIADRWAYHPSMRYASITDNGRFGPMMARGILIAIGVVGILYLVSG